MDGENNGKLYEKWDDVGVPLFLKTPIFSPWMGEIPCHGPILDDLPLFGRIGRKCQDWLISLLFVILYILFSIMVQWKIALI